MHRTIRKSTPLPKMITQSKNGILSFQFSTFSHTFLSTCHFLAFKVVAVASYKVWFTTSYNLEFIWPLPSSAPTSATSGQDCLFPFPCMRIRGHKALPLLPCMAYQQCSLECWEETRLLAPADVGGDWVSSGGEQVQLWPAHQPAQLISCRRENNLLVIWASSR